MSVWQLSNGNGRNLSEYYLAMGVACIGPGIKIKENQSFDDFKQETSSIKEASALWSFVKETKAGDIILVKETRNTFSLIGVIEENHAGGGTYMYVDRENAFIDGWRLSHQIKVKWFKIKDGKYDEAQENVLKNDYSFPRVRFSKCNGLKLPEVEFLGKITRNEINYLECHAPTPDLYKPLKHDLPHQYVLSGEESRLCDCQRSSSWSLEAFRKIFFVVPFLRKLGWAPEMMAFEYGLVNKTKIDIILYSDYEHTKPFCLIETKPAWSSLKTFAMSQAEDYYKNFFPEEQKKHIKLLISTDGVFIYGRTTDRDDPATFEIDRRAGKMTDELSLSYLHPTTYIE